MKANKTNVKVRINKNEVKATIARVITALAGMASIILPIAEVKGEFDLGNWYIVWVAAQAWILFVVYRYLELSYKMDIKARKKRGVECVDLLAEEEDNTEDENVSNNAQFRNITWKSDDELAKILGKK